MHRQVPDGVVVVPIPYAAFGVVPLHVLVVFNTPAYLKLDPAFVLPGAAAPNVDPRKAYVPTAPTSAADVRASTQSRSLFPVFSAAAAIFGAPTAPSAIATGLSRNASPSIDRIGLPGSIELSGIVVQSAMSFPY
jgi:uncharacterized MAPEG superfamily protein